MNKLYIGLAALLITASCKPDIEVSSSAVNNQANFSKYIAVGNSLTSGFADGGLYLEGQRVAFPNLIAEKMKAHGGGEFHTPFFSEAQANGSGYIRLAALVNGQPQMQNVEDKRAFQADGSLTKYEGAMNNFGVPGMRLDHSGVGLVSAANMYFARLVPKDQEGRVSYQDLVDNQNHTFFSFWLGNNDVLGYAMNGAVNDNPSGTTALTSTQVFTAVLNQFIGKLTANNQKGVIATIPDVTAVPYFTTVTRQALLAGASAATGTPISNLFITTKTQPSRLATDNDMFVLPFSSLGKLGIPNAAGKPYGLHPENPIEDKYVLDEAEVTEVKNRINEFNTVIRNVANSKGLALADAHAFLNKVKNGYQYNGFMISNKFITGNAFSLDGIHLTPIGNAIIGNVFIDAINTKYGSNLSKIDVTKYSGVKLP